MAGGSAAAILGVHSPLAHSRSNYPANLQGRLWYYIYPLLKGNSV